MSAVGLLIPKQTLKAKDVIQTNFISSTFVIMKYFKFPFAQGPSIILFPLLVLCQELQVLGVFHLLHRLPLLGHCGRPLGVPGLG